jgi:hypothetical protein
MAVEAQPILLLEGLVSWLFEAGSFFGQNHTGKWFAHRPHIACPMEPAVHDCTGRLRAARVSRSAQKKIEMNGTAGVFDCKQQSRSTS